MLGLMRKRNVNAYFQIAGETFRVNNNASLGCFDEILTDLFSQLTNLLSHHSRVLFLRLDLRVYEYAKDNSQLTRWIRQLKRRLKSYFGFTRIGYLWVRELSRAKK